MIIAKIVQKGQIITLEDVVTTFQYSANLKMQFIIDESYKDCIITGWYRKFWKKEEKYLLDMQEDGTFLLGQDVFENDGTVEFSFALNYQDGKIVHLGVVEYYVKKSFGNSDAILPENEDAWITVVSQAVKLQMQKEWDKDYSPQLEENLHVIDNKVDEINLTAAEVKQNALESFTNAQSALESANNANDSANLAESAKEKALEYSSSAERFKNEASTYASQANLAKSDAQQSAKDASNSASSALQNANKAKEHLDNVNSAVNTFNADYTTKVENFNTSVESANNTLSVKIEEANTDLDTKITEANSSINTKVTIATEHANKAKTEADRAVLATDGKLDKNQGVENAGKAMVVGEDGNVVPGSALPDNVYTQAEVDYMLLDKMDKPYVPIEITDNATITDALEGNFKIDKIKGNTYQNVETDIVPTPNRPVPINSRKVKAGDEYVELRSLKETGNLFDLGLLSRTELIEKTSESYRKINIPLKLKQNTRYTFKFENSTVPAFTWVVLRIIKIPEGTSGFVQINNIKNTSNEPLQIDSKALSFTTDTSDGDVYFSYYVQSFNEDGVTLKPQTSELFEELWFTKWMNNIMLVEGESAPSTYIPPTIRDYKIVDHANKTAKIIRNVRQRLLTAKNNFYRSGYGGMEINLKDVKLMNRNESAVTYCNLFNHHVSNSIPNNLCYRLDNNYLQFNYEGYNEKTLWDKFITDNELYIQYQLATPVEETITYVETDTSEVGYSWQDTTSPSPSIKSEVQGVEEIDVTVTGKNLVNGYDNFTILKSGTYCLSTNKLNVKTRLDFALYDENKELIRDNIVSFVGSQFYLQPNGTYRLSNDANAIKSKITFDDERVKFIKIIFSNLYIKFDEIQLEVGDTATEYEPYQGNSIRYALEKPLLKIGDIADTINITKENRENKLNSIVLDGSEDETWNINNLGYETTIRFQYTVVTSNYPSGTNHKVNCNKFNNILGDISNREYVRLTSAGNGYSYLWVYIKKIRLEEVSVTGFRKWLRENPLKVIYDTSYVVTEPLEVELMEKLRQLKTYSPATNIFIEGEVKPIYNCQYPKDLLLAQQKLESTILTLQEEVVKNV